MMQFLVDDIIKTALLEDVNYIDAAADQHGFKAEVIRVVPDQCAVFPTNNGIDSAQACSNGRKLIAVGDDRAFVGNGYIKSLIVAIAEQVF